MKSILFTKPKEMTLKCLKFLFEEKEEILAVVIPNKEQYLETEFFNYCLRNNIKIYSDSEIYENINLFQEIEIIYSNTYPYIIKNEIIKKATKKAINFHSAPLPEYRGVFGYNFAFLNKETEYGVSVHELNDNFDMGDIIEVLKFPYDFKNGNLKELVKLTDEYLFQLFRKTYYRLKNNENFDVVEQIKENGKYYSRKMFEKSKQINLENQDENIDEKIKAFWYPPFEPEYIKKNEKKYYLLTEKIYKSIKWEK